MKNIIFATTLFICNIASTMPLSAAIASGNDCGDNCNWEISDTGTLSITGTGSIKDFTRINCETDCTTSAPWRQYASTVTALVINEGIERIGYDAFEDMDYIQNIQLPNTLTSIGALAFHSNNSLQSLVVPDNVTEIGAWAISHTGIKELVLPENLETIGANALGGNNSLKTLVLPEGLKNLDPSVLIGVAAYDIKVLSKLYCAQANKDACTTAAEKLGITPILYTKTNNGFIADNKRYHSLSDMASNNGFPIRRIYTIDEANQLTGKKNKVMIRYK